MINLIRIKCNRSRFNREDSCSHDVTESARRIDVYINISDVSDHERGDSGSVRKLIALQYDLPVGDSRGNKKGYERERGI